MQKIAPSGLYLPHKVCNVSLRHEKKFIHVTLGSQNEHNHSPFSRVAPAFQQPMPDAQLVRPETTQKPPLYGV